MKDKHCEQRIEMNTKIKICENRLNYTSGNEGHGILAKGIGGNWKGLRVGFEYFG